MSRLAAAVLASLALAPAAHAQTLGEDPYAGAYSGDPYDAQPPSAATAAPPPSGDSSDLAKQLANPVASLVSAPFQYNYNSGFGEDGDGDQSYINFQPVIPFSLNENWNVISRTILPLVWNDGVVPGEDHQFGLGATTQSFFFSPKAPTAAGLIWGVGPAFLLPTATDHIATNQWGAGVTGVALRQSGPWTVGALANHLWSLTGDSADGDINQTFLQPFVNYTTPKATTFTLNTEFDLRLGGAAVVGADQRPGRADDQGRPPAAAVRRRRPLLGRRAGERPGRLGRPRGGDLPLPQVGSPAEAGRQLHVTRPAELVYRLHPVQPVAPRHQDRRVPREARRIARHRRDHRHA